MSKISAIIIALAVGLGSVSAFAADDMKTDAKPKAAAKKKPAAKKPAAKKAEAKKDAAATPAK